MALRIGLILFAMFCIVEHPLARAADRITFANPPRLWTDATTRQSVEARLLKIEPDKITVRRTSDGRKFAASPSRFVEKDQAYILRNTHRPAARSFDYASITALRQKTEFAEVKPPIKEALPLAEVLPLIAEIHGVQVGIDFTAFQNATLSDEVPITVDLTGKPLLIVLQAMLLDTGIAWVIRENGYEFTSRSAAEKSYDYFQTGNSSPTLERAYATLRERADFQWKQAPLKNVMQTLSDKHEIKIAFDKPSLDDAGIDTAIPLTFSASDISLRSGLKHLLGQLELTYMIANDGSLLITTPERARQDAALIDFSHRDFWYENLTKSLSQKTSLQFDAQPLPQVLAALQEKHALNFTVDERSLFRQDLEMPVITADVKDVSLLEALDLVASKAGLEYELRDEVVTFYQPQISAELAAQIEARRKALFPDAESEAEPEDSDGSDK